MIPTTIPPHKRRPPWHVRKARALALAQALGIDTLITAELLPEIEAVMVRKLNEQMGEADPGGLRP